MAQTDLNVNVDVIITRKQAEKCLRLLEMFLDDNPDIVTICEEKTYFQDEISYIKHFLHFERRFKD